MKVMLILAGALLASSAASAQSYSSASAYQPAQTQATHVNGYTRKDGTYVQPHYRSHEDNNKQNNWSSKPNVNPYTGQQGTRDPNATDNADDDDGGG